VNYDPAHRARQPIVPNFEESPVSFYGTPIFSGTAVEIGATTERETSPSMGEVTRGLADV
jgi:hypothetical protein